MAFIPNLLLLNSRFIVPCCKSLVCLDCKALSESLTLDLFIMNVVWTKNLKLEKKNIFFKFSRSNKFQEE